MSARPWTVMLAVSPKQQDFEPSAGRHAFLPGADGTLGAVIFGQEDDGKAKDPFLAGKLPGLLPRGTYRFANAPHDERLAALGFALGTYRFSRYGKKASEVRLELSSRQDEADLSRIADAIFLARDLINTPSNDMGPAELAEAALTVAAGYGAAIRIITGDDLITQNFPLDPCGWPCRCVGARAASDRHHLGRSRRAQGHAGRQGRLLRQRRPRHQADRGHAADEEGHGRRRERAGARRR